MYENILFPIDGTDALEEVFPHTADIGRRRGATVHILYVVDDRAFLTLADEMQDDVIEEFRAEGQAVLSTAERRFEDENISTVSELRRGNPAEQILEYVSDADIDLVTMGTHGDDYQESVVGSVSQKVAKSATVPVLTINV